MWYDAVHWLRYLSQGGSGKDRYRYKCDNCQDTWVQKRPDKMYIGENPNIKPCGASRDDRGNKWHDLLPRMDKVELLNPFRTRTQISASCVV